MALVSARGLTKSYGPVRALDGATFEIGEGVTGLLGSNGAGKTTSLKLFMGLIEADSGSVEVLGANPTASPEYRGRIGYAPEHDCLPRNVSAAEFLAYLGEVSGLPRTPARLRASDVLRHVGLFEERYRPIGTYSTGMKQKVKLAQALVHDPVIAFLDEPTAGLDPMGRRDMLELIRHVGREFGISIVISTHLMGDVERTCDAVVVLDAGRVLRTGAVSGLTEETEAVLVDVVDAADTLAAALERRGLAVRTDGNRLTLPQVSGDDYDTLRDAIVETDVLLYRLAPERHTLADVFTPAAGGDRGRERRAAVSTLGPAEIFDLGYQPYEGERRGRWPRRRAIWRDGIRTSLGLGRGTAAKIAPWLLIGLALVPMVVLVVLAAFLGSVPTSADDFELPSYAEYFDYALLPLGLFAAVVAPLLLCPDRRDGVLSLYAARPITPRDYIGARWAAFFTVAVLVVCVPELVLFIWNALDAGDFGSWFEDNWDTAPRFLLAGTAVAAVYTTLTLFIASFTARRAYATIATLAVLFIGSAIGQHRRGELPGRRRRRALARGDPAGADGRRVLDLRRPAQTTGPSPPPCPRSGSPA